MRYEFVIRNEKERTYLTIRYIFVLLNMIGMIAVLLQSPKSFTNLAAPATALTLSVIYFLTVFFRKFAKKIKLNNFHFFALVFNAVAWARTDYWWLSALVVVFIVLDIFVHRELVIRVEKNFVQLPTVPVKKLSWKELNNVVLKDGIITVDTRSNHIFQHAILDDDIDEKDFNQFCIQQLSI